MVIFKDPLVIPHHIIGIRIRSSNVMTISISISRSLITWTPKGSPWMAIHWTTWFPVIHSRPEISWLGFASNFVAHNLLLRSSVKCRSREHPYPLVSLWYAYIIIPRRLLRLLLLLILLLLLLLHNLRVQFFLLPIADVVSVASGGRLHEPGRRGFQSMMMVRNPFTRTITIRKWRWKGGPLSLSTSVDWLWLTV